MTPAPSVITVVLVDDHEMLLETLARALGREPDIVVAATAGTVADGLAAIERVAPDVAVIDYQLPDGDGAAMARQVTASWPGVTVVMLTGSDRPGAVFEAAQAGCAGYLEKTKAPSELVRVVRSVHAGVRELPHDRLSELPTLDQLVVHYQPIVDLHTEAVVGFEALVRWQHPTRGLVGPAEFMGLAEQTSFVLDIDAAVREVACGQAAQWNSRFASSPPRFMSVNVSGREVQQPDFPARIERTLERAQLEAPLLVVEITETFLVREPEDCNRRVQELKDLGVRIALDDFGTAYSSLSYLQRFPIDIIKLDKSFTDDLPDGARALSLVQALSRFAADMGAVTEAEGIETQAQADCLKARGWEIGQGYHYARPMSASAIEPLLS
jgi:EAL domain-containing protein (putative c-di-GMP-specific phosphodiesterase class I)